MTAAFQPALSGGAPAPGDGVVAVAEDGVLVAGDALPRVGDLAGPTDAYVELGRLGDSPVWGVAVAGPPPPGLTAVGLRALHDRLGEPLWALAGRGAQLVAWDRDHAFCGRCATPTGRAPAEHVRTCPRCGLTARPRLSPAVIVLVERDGTALLARSARAGRRFHSTLAGFVEPGESLEQAVRREVREEVDVELGAIRYFGSQPWPFPDALMIAFVADHAASEPRPDGVEIAEAGWYRPDALPEVPPPLSIARALIEDFRRRHGVAPG